MALTITVNGAGTFTASMEEGPVSFSASLGAIGPAGPGVAAGGTTGQILVKTTNADYATGWIDNAARSVFISGRNNTGSTIAKGAVVYLSGATGNKATIALAQANSESTSARTIGITKAEVANGADVDVVISGAIENIDTSAFSAGQVVYLSATVAGGLTTTLPTQPNHGVVVGIVTRSNANQGSIEVTVQNYQELKELSDVLVSSPSNGQVLTYDSGLWKNLAIPAPDLSAYLTSATAAATYQTIAGMSDYLSKAGNLSGLASASTARTNLGLGTMATESASTYAPLASPALTGTPTAPTAAASTNTTQIATTAFVQQEVPSASTTVAGKVELATDAEAVAGTSTTLAVTPSGLKAEGLKATRLAIGTAAMTATTSGVGASTAQNGNQKQVGAPTTAAGHATLYYNFLVHPLQAYNSNIDWSKRHEFEFLIIKGVTTSDANTVGRVKIGQPSFSGTPGDLSARGVGIRIPGNGNIFLMVHDGTNLTTVDSGIVATGSTMRLILKIVSDGAGNVTLYSSGSQVATTSAGPTSQGGGNGIIYEAQNLATISTTAMQLVFGNFVADFGY